MICQCCKVQKARVHSLDSRLLNGNSVVLCTQCANSKHEPRHNIIIASYSRKDVSEYIVNNLYCGNRLSAQEVIHKL